MLIGMERVLELLLLNLLLPTTLQLMLELVTQNLSLVLLPHIPFPLMTFLHFQGWGVKFRVMKLRHMEIRMTVNLIALHNIILCIVSQADGIHTREFHQVRDLMLNFAILCKK